MTSLEDILFDSGKKKKGKEIKESIEQLSSYLDLGNKLSSYFDLGNKEYKIITENFEEYYTNSIIIKISKKFSSIQSSPLGINLTLADNIGEFALPIVEYIRQTQPDYIVASDRGARLLGLAVFRLYNGLYGGFPSADGTIRFRRFSKSNTQEATEQHLQPLVDEMLAYKKKPTVLVLDDWVCSGGTKKLAHELFDRLGKGKIKVKFGVLIGEGADVSGHSSHLSGFAGVTDWGEDSNIIGIRYGNCNWGSSGIKAEPVRSEQARDYRKRMYEGIDRLVKDITEKGKEEIMTRA